MLGRGVAVTAGPMHRPQTANTAPSVKVTSHSAEAERHDSHRITGRRDLAVVVVAVAVATVAMSTGSVMTRTPHRQLH